MKFRRCWRMEEQLRIEAEKAGKEFPEEERCPELDEEPEDEAWWEREEKIREERIAGKLSIFKNNTDFVGNSYGCHENYLVDRDVAEATFEALDYREKNGYQRHRVSLEFCGDAP